MAVSNRRSFENCSQLVAMIRYGLGDPQEFVNKGHFPTGHYFGFVEDATDYCIEQNTYRHKISFSWAIGRPFTRETEMPEISSPVITIDGCVRRWRFTMNNVWGIGNASNEHDVYLTWINIEKDASVKAYVKMDLYKGADKMGTDAVTIVSFDEVVPRHVVYTGADLKSRSRTEETDNGFYDLNGTYTIQGVLNLSDCCVDLTRQHMPNLQAGFLTG